MDYAFRVVENFVLRADKKLTSSRSDGRARRELFGKVEQAKRTFRLLVLAAASDDSARKLITSHQRGLLSFANRSSVAEDLSRNLWVRTLLEFLETEYPKYFDFDVAIPDFLHHDLIAKVSECIAMMEELILLKRIEQGLENLVHEALSSIQQNRALATFATMSSVTVFHHRIASLLADQHPVNEMEDHVLAIFVETDIDVLRVYRHFAARFQSALAKTNSDQERLNLIALQLKEVNQVPLSLYTPAPKGHLKTLLVEWLLNELQYLERQVTTRFAVTDSPQTGSDANFKLTVDLSVAQLAFVTRALVESGVIQNKNTTEMMSFLSKFINTKRSGRVSPESLRIKYYDVESATKDSVRSLLHNAIGYINRS